MERRQVVLPQRAPLKTGSSEEVLKRIDINQTENRIGAYFATVKNLDWNTYHRINITDCVLGGGWPLGPNEQYCRTNLLENVRLIQQQF